MGVIQWLAAQGRGLVVVALTICIFTGAAAVGAFVGRRRSSVLGWAAGIFALIVFCVIFYPTVQTLRHMNCSDYGVDRESCDEPPEM